MSPAKKCAPVIVGLAVVFSIILHVTFNGQTGLNDYAGSSFRRGHEEDGTTVKDWSQVEQIQQERKLHLKQSCAALGYSPRFVTRNLDKDTLKQFYRIQVIPELKAIYCPIPKVASTSFRRFLLNATNRKAVHPIQNSKRVFPKLSSLPLKDAQRILRTYKTFLFVRNPYVRILSAYKDKLTKGDNQFRQEVEEWYEKHAPKELVGMNSSDSFTFKQFVKHYIKTKDKNVHWEDMMELCHVCKIDYNFIGHLETLKDDSDYLTYRLNIRNGISFPGETHKHQTNSSQGDSLEIFYSELADGQFKDLSLSQGLARDAIAFGYDTPDSIARV